MTTATITISDFSEVPAIDAHCHPFQVRSLTWQLLLDSLSLSTSGPVSALNESTLLSRIAVRGLADFFGCEPVAEELVAARNAAASDDYAAFVGRLFASQGIAGLLIDPGYPDLPVIDAHFPRRLGGGVVYGSFTN